MVGKIIRANNGRCRVEFENEETWWYDSECLELQKPEPVQPVKVEKTEKVVSDVEIIKILRKCLDLK